MSFAFPQFHERIQIDGTRSWTADFDSYDQKNDDCYYRVTIWEGDRDMAPFHVVVALDWACDDWTGPGFVARLRDELQKVARDGKPNTTYDGAVVR
jgi:hypothetical protein